MEELKQIVLDEVLNKIIKYNNGVRYIIDTDLNTLNLTELERKFVMYVLEEEKITIEKKVTKNDRPSLVRDYNYGDIATNNLESIDTPEKSIIEYDKNENLSFKDFSELEKYLDNVFIPRYVQMKQVFDKTADDIIYEPSIQLNRIVKLKLSEIEVQYVFEYLDKLNIKVAGISPDIEMDSNIKNYNYVRTFKESPKPDYDPNLNDEQRILTYQQTKDMNLRNEIIKNNMRLASYVAYKYSVITGINIHELESYAYEGLITAIENFKNIGCKFSTYAYPCIRGYILKGIPNIQNFSNRNFYYNYISCKNIVEEMNGITLEQDPKLLKDVYELMHQTKGVSGCSYSEFANLVSITSPTLMDMDEVESEYDILDEVIDNITKENVLEMLEFLTERERVVIINRFGLYGNKLKTLEEVAKMLNVTRERIRQIEVKALRKLRYRHPRI